MTPAPFCVTSTDSLERARVLMNRHRVRHLPVIDGGELIGVVVDREMVVIESIRGLDPRTIAVTRAMRPALSVSANMPIDEALDLMLEHELDCVVVRDASGRVEGIFTAVDALDAIVRLSRTEALDPRALAS